ncbi:hypothetical protein Moror_1642 [Moniliophthora roreri MCA 2997]|uniref:Uncharacterized protein n=1 Tax=Moniliophthora roreri (strain MCA 2997) TaxID=1381753 RepID=V2X311_MONRO|nr:hypothetical protein Moror_1642 [Moniliophthora roreri MCA 2997]
MSSEIPEEFAGLLTVDRSIIYPISNLSALYFIYGFYVLLFGICVYMMRGRQQDNEHLNHNLYLSLTVVLFVLSTVFVAAKTVEEVRRSIFLFTTLQTGDYEPLLNYLTIDVTKTVIFALLNIVAVLMNIAAELMLIHRCYLIWGSKKRVAVPLLTASILINAVGLVSAIAQTIGIKDPDDESTIVLFNDGATAGFVYNIVSVVINSVLTLLTAGRIWWIHRQVVRIHGMHINDTLISSVSRIILESGVLYPAFAIVSLITTNTTTMHAMPFDFWAPMVLIAGVAPTLILVRAKLGKNVKSLQIQISDIHFSSRPAPRGDDSVLSRTQVYSTGNPYMMAAEFQGEGSEQRFVDEKEAR